MPRLLDQVFAFRYVTAENAPSYRAIVEVFSQARERYQIELRPADVREALARSGLRHELDLADEAGLDRHLDQLDAWGNLQRSHDTAAVARVEDFYRRRYLYRLTPVGEAAHRAVREVEETVGRSGALQTSMLVEIRDALAALAEAERGSDAAGLARALHRLRSAFDSLTEEANLFLSELDRHVSAERVDEERFLAHKHALLAYLGRFVADLKKLAPEIAERVADAEALSPDRFIGLAANGAELPPALDGGDPVAQWVAAERARWDGIRAWFAGTAGEPPRVERLQAKARDSVARLTRALTRLDERHARSVDRAADFRTLARWCAEAASDDAAHALYASALGLYPARHFHLTETDPELTRASTSWWEAEPVEVPVRLRTHGAVSRAGRPPPVLSFADGRAWLAARRKRERAQLDAALSRFAGRGPVRLSDIATLDASEFDQLLALLDEALCSTRDAGGARRTRSADGRLDIVLRPPADERAWTAIETPRGRLRCRDYLVEARVASPERTAAVGGGTP
ncbi:MAG TPA: TIGR02677 family protein [Anaeromyxobacteraceae bacterium]|nr:TIGR02677 family protein [Anaeromyxobacteraceae bacterium]